MADSSRLLLIANPLCLILASPFALLPRARVKGEPEEGGAGSPTGNSPHAIRSSVKSPVPLQEEG